MVNSLVFMGRIENFCEEKNGIKLLISHHAEEGTFVVPVYMNFKPKKEIISKSVFFISCGALLI